MNRQKLEAAICTIGDEILIGQIIDTNSAEISKALGAIGIRVKTMVSIADEHEQIASSVKALLAAHDIVITTGGLGPTKDDITKKTLAELSGAKGWHTDAVQLEIIERILSKRGIARIQANLDQALVPDTCTVIPNKLGTAPNMAFRFTRDKFDHCPTLYSLPGVPYEVTGALEDITEDIRAHYSLADIRHRTICTYGIAESILAKTISEWEDALPQGMKLAYLPNPATGVRLRLSMYGGEGSAEESLMDAQIHTLEGILGESIYGYGDATLQSVIGQMLKDNAMTVSAAESCTGGMISQLLTSVSGASQYYLGSVTSYANSVKCNILGVNPETIEKFGAVSSECVAEMAQGVRRLTGSDFAVATSGIAGPGGATADKPVGLVWIAVASTHGVTTEKFLFSSDRERNIIRFASCALNKLRLEIRKFTSK